MTQRVVHLLEAVEIEQQHREPRAALQQAVDPALQLATVRETGQRIARRRRAVRRGLAGEVFGDLASLFVFAPQSFVTTAQCVVSIAASCRGGAAYRPEVLLHVSPHLVSTRHRLVRRPS